MHLISGDKTILSKIVSERADTLERSARQVVTDAFYLGEALVSLKSVCDHGEFTKAVHQNTQFSVRTAQQFMRIYKAFEHNQDGMREHLTITSALKAIGETEPVKQVAVLESDNGTKEQIESDEIELALRVLGNAVVVVERLRASLYRS